MLTIESILSKDILALVIYEQPTQLYTKITLIRGHGFVCRLVNNSLHECCKTDNPLQKVAEWVAFEEKLGSKLL